MDVNRKWFCSCSGKPLELIFEQPAEEEDIGEPACLRCGATPSSDPKHTITFKDVEEWDL